MVAHTLLQFADTPWLEEPTSIVHHISLMHLKQEPLSLADLWLHRSFRARRSPGATFVQPDRNLLVFSFGVMLVELAYQRPLAKRPRLLAELELHGTS